jgi:hypothetical protein
MATGPARAARRRGTPNPSSAWWVVILASAALGCDGSGTDADGRPFPTSCADAGGTEYSGATGSSTWRPADGPHRLRDTVSVSALVIEAGALVCAAPGAAIVATVMRAEGTAESPILFTAEQPGQPWAGILASTVESANIYLAHVRIEDALVGVRGSTGTIEVRQSVIRRVRGPGLIFGGPGGGATMIDTQVDSACLSGCTDPSFERASVTVLSRKEFRFENSEITNSGAAGLSVDFGSGVTLLGGRIEGSAGIGLDLRDDPGRPVTVREARPIRITGGSTHPARVSIHAANLLLPTADAYDEWRGNASDTVLVTLFWGADRTTIHPGLVWAVGPGTSPEATIRALELEPGAALHIVGPYGLLVDHLVSAGTPAAPVEISAGTSILPTTLLLPGREGADTSRVVHTRFRNARVVVQEPHPIMFEDVVAEDGELVLSAPGARLRRVRLQGVHEVAGAALTIAAPEIEVTLSEITGSTADGLRVEVATDVRVSQCNIHGNAGVGIRNVSAEAVDARDNWWGDAQGPFGPQGDGLAGNVEFEPHRAEPVQTGAPGS